MTVQQDTVLETITLTNSAAEAVRDLIAQKNLEGYVLRLFISGGGCSGYQYGLALDNKVRPEDTISETDGIKLVVDEVSVNYLRGATVDYVNEETESGFKIINPNPVSSCSCGQNSDCSDEESSQGCSGCG